MLLSARTEQHFSALTAQINQQQVDLAKMDQQIMEVWQEIPAEVQQQVRPLLQELESQKTVIENQKTMMGNQRATLEKPQEWLSMMVRRPQTIINRTSDGTGHAAVMVGKSSIFEIPTFNGTGSWELYHMQFEAAAAYSEWTDIEKAVVLTVHLKKAVQQVPIALLQSHIIEYGTQVNYLEQRFG